MNYRSAALALWLAEAAFWLGWLVMIWGGPFVWAIYGSMHVELRALRRDLRAARPDDSVDWFLRRQTPRRTTGRHHNGTQDLGDTGHQDLGYPRRLHYIPSQVAEPLYECPHCHVREYEPPNACYCGTPGVRFKRVVTPALLLP